MVQEGVCLREEWLEGKGEVSSHGPDRHAGTGIISSGLGLQRHAYTCVGDSLNCIFRIPGLCRTNQRAGGGAPRVYISQKALGYRAADAVGVFNNLYLFLARVVARPVRRRSSCRL